MVDVKSVEAQLKRIKFNWNAWGKAEAKELPHILHPDEEVYECVNGIYDGGFALLVATDMRVLLIDKKPLNYLTVEDLRFDMINEMDYSHRLLGARITISAGNKTLKFMSYNQRRLRKLISHVQDRMSQMKREASEHQENQKQHLAQINQQLQAYLLAQHQQLMVAQQGGGASSQPIKPSPELADYLFAQSLLAQFGGADGKTAATPAPVITQDEPADQAATAQVAAPDTPATDGQPANEPAAAVQTAPVPAAETPAETEPATVQATAGDESNESEDLFTAGYREVFGKVKHSTANAPATSQPTASQIDFGRLAAKSLEVNPLRIAYAKLPMMLRNRKFGRPSFHAHSQATKATKVTKQTQPATQ